MPSFVTRCTPVQCSIASAFHLPSDPTGALPRSDSCSHLSYGGFSMKSTFYAKSFQGIQNIAKRTGGGWYLECFEVSDFRPHKGKLFKSSLLRDSQRSEGISNEFNEKIVMR